MGYGNLVDTTPCQVWTAITLDIEVNAFTDYLLGSHDIGISMKTLAS